MKACQRVGLRKESEKMGVICTQCGTLLLTEPSVKPSYRV